MPYVQRPPIKPNRTTRTALRMVTPVLLVTGIAVAFVAADPTVRGSDWFAALWSLLLIPITWLFGWIMNRRLEFRAHTEPAPAPPQSVFDSVRTRARAEAKASASAQAESRADARAHATSGAAKEDDPWEPLIVGLVAVGAAYAVLSVIGVFFAGVRVVATSFTMVLYAMVGGYVVAAIHTLRRQGALDGGWLAILTLAGCICATAFAAGVVALQPTLAGGRYAEMVDYFDRFGRDGLKGFGLTTSSAYLGLQALGVIALTVIAGWLLLQLSGLMAMRYEQQLGLLPAAKLAVRSAPFGPYGSPLLAWILLVIPLALVLSGLPYNWSFVDARKAVDFNAPKIRKIEVVGTARPVLHLRVNEVATANVVVERLRRHRRPLREQHVVPLLPGPATIQLCHRDRRLRPGNYRVMLAVRDAAGNRARVKHLGFSVTFPRRVASHRG